MCHCRIALHPGLLTCDRRYRNLPITSYQANGNPLTARDSEDIIWGLHEYDLGDSPGIMSIDGTYAEGTAALESENSILCFAGGLLTSQYPAGDGPGYAVAVLEEIVSTDTAVYYMAFHSEGEGSDTVYEGKYVKVQWLVSGDILTQYSSAPQDTIAAARTATTDTHTAVLEIVDPPAP